MASHLKLQKLSHIDRITDLPDSLILHILTFLSVKSAALTSSLSKRWEPLHLALPNLDFNDDDFCGSPTNFIKCVDYMLMARRNNVVLERFSLTCTEDIDAGCVDSWLQRSVRYYNVKVIKLSLDFTTPYKLPTEIHTCTTLEVLTLNSNILIDVPQFLSLKRLRVLELCDVTFSSSESMEKILINCPLLEKLLIQDSACLTGKPVINIIGSVLKTLHLQYSAHFEEVQLKFLIDAAAVVNLCINRVEAVEIKTPMLFLETATIDDHLNVQSSTVNKDRVFGILEMISYVRCLTLSSNIVGALSFAATNSRLPVFHNLTYLELSLDGGAGPVAGWSLLPKILASSPILVNLVFPHGLAWGFNAGCKPSRFSFIKPENVPECLSFHLKNIQIGDFRGITEEYIIIQYLLKNGGVLNIMSIDCSGLWLKEMTVGMKRKRHRPLTLSEIKKKLLGFHRCSMSCKLDLSP